MKRRICVIGYFDRGNLGDNAMRDALLRHLRQRLPESRIAAASLPSPRHPWEVLGLLRRLIACDAVVLAGGTHFHDLHGHDSQRVLLQFLALLLPARLAGARIAYAGIGVGPLATAAGRRLTAMLLRLPAAALMRDEPSLSLARQLAPAGSYVQGYDLVLLDEGEPAAEAVGAPPRLGVSLVSSMPFAGGSPARDEAMASSLSEAINRAAATRPGMEVEVLVLSRSPGHSDAAISRRLLALLDPSVRAVLVDAPEPEVARGRMRRLSGFIGARYHGLLLAYQAGLPLLPVVYHRKVDDLADQLGLAPGARLRPGNLFTQPDAASLVEDLLSAPASFRASLAVAEARQRAAESLDQFLADLRRQTDEPAAQSPVRAALSRFRRAA